MQNSRQVELDTVKGVISRDVSTTLPPRRDVPVASHLRRSIAGTSTNGPPLVPAHELRWTSARQHRLCVASL
ncbi:hypothetical protein MRX96_058317 [Rhipicephalus microplus]